MIIVAYNFSHIYKKSFSQVIEKSGIENSGAYGGISWGDYNNDGYLDLLIRDNSGGYKLYRNNKGLNFTDVTQESGLITTSHATTATFGDYNNDGCEDIFIGNGFDGETGTPSTLYKNNCNGTFEDVSESAGINKEKLHTRGVAWGDYNNDGFIDIYISTWGEINFNKSESAWKLINWKSEPNILYKNNGDGTFTNVTKIAGVGGEAKCDKYMNFNNKPKRELLNENQEGKNNYPGLKSNWQPIWFDYNNDGLPDIYVSHEVTTNALYKNNGNGTFTDVTEQAGLCQLHSTHGVAVGDYNGDGYLDLYITGSLRNLFYINNGNGTFKEVSEENNTADFGFLGWGVGALDYNNDGNLDIYVVNGSSQNTSVKYNYPSRLDALFENDGHGNFKNVSQKAGLFGNDFKTFGAFADYNNDGFTDALILSDPDPNIATSPNLPNRLYKNQPNGNHWLTIRLLGTKSNKDGIGAKLIIESQGKKQYREVGSGGSLMSQNSPWPTFGLNQASIVDELTIKWPSGSIQTLHSLKTNQILIIKEK